MSADPVPAAPSTQFLILVNSKARSHTGTPRKAQIASVPPPRRIHSCRRKTIFQFMPPFCRWQAPDGSLRKLAIANIPTIASLPFQLTTSQGGRHIKLTPTNNPAPFQLTTSRRGRQPDDKIFSKVRAFQLTTSQGGRLKIQCLAYITQAISTHNLAKRSTLHNFATH